MANMWDSEQKVFVFALTLSYTRLSDNEREPNEREPNIFSDYSIVMHNIMGSKSEYTL